MIQLVGPTRVAQPMRLNGEDAIVALYMDEPPTEWLAEYFAAEKLKTKKKKDEAAAKLFAPARLAPWVNQWEGVGGIDEKTKQKVPAPCTVENVVSAAKHKQFQELLVAAAFRAIAVQVEKNSPASPAGSTGEAPAAAAPVAAEPSDAA